MVPRGYRRSNHPDEAADGLQEKEDRNAQETRA